MELVCLGQVKAVRLIILVKIDVWIKVVWIIPKRMEICQTAVSSGNRDRIGMKWHQPVERWVVRRKTRISVTVLYRWTGRGIHVLVNRDSGQVGNVTICRTPRVMKLQCTGSRIYGRWRSYVRERGAPVIVRLRVDGDGVASDLGGAEIAIRTACGGGKVRLRSEGAGGQCDCAAADRLQCPVGRRDGGGRGIAA